MGNRSARTPSPTAAVEELPDGLFSEATTDWFRAAFAAPTPAQLGAWRAIAQRQNALVIAPTGSGKTLAAFLWALDSLLVDSGVVGADAGCRILYVSPLKALAADIERNLRTPLAGIAGARQRRGESRPDISVSMRSGDTPAAERRRFATHPSDILITTPESLFLLLTSAARTSLATVETVIVDEVHAVADSKRGAHLALSLERLDALLARPAQRIGLSATVEPPAEVARFLAGSRPVTIIDPPRRREMDLVVSAAVEDFSDLGGARSSEIPGQLVGLDPEAHPGLVGGSGGGVELPPELDLEALLGGQQKPASMWPHIEERLVDLISAHRSTIVFVNSRRLAERVTARINEIWAERLDLVPASDPDPATDLSRDSSAPPRVPAELMGAAGSSGGAAAVLARAHHGSVSKEQRREVEEALKMGTLPAVVATSSLELGIDMGAVDLMVQLGAPPSVASGLQRIGRAGHQVGAISHGIVLPLNRNDLLMSAVVGERMEAGAIERVRIPANPLDVLAQHLVAMVAIDSWSVADAFALTRRAAPFAMLTKGVFTAVLDMLSGRYPSEDFSELRPRLVWDRIRDELTGRPGAQRLAVTSGGAIPDRGLFGVFLAGGGEGPGRRVGELDEEMVYESRVGDVITLGTSSWRIAEITNDQVLVLPAPGEPGRLPFWRGDAPGRPAELGLARGAMLRELLAAEGPVTEERLRAVGLDDWARQNLRALLIEQRDATGALPDDRTVVVESFRDEIGDWRVVIHTPIGSPVTSPWALVISQRIKDRLGIDVQAMPADDGIVLRLPEIEESTEGGRSDWIEDLVEDLRIEPDEILAAVQDALGGSALFAARFRECAARSLLLPRRNPTKRQPLWQQRQRSSHLLSVASRHPEFPVMLETARECLQDVFDVAALKELLTRFADGSVRILPARTDTASPFARHLLFGYVGRFLYEGDAPLAEQRSAALALDPALLAELLGDTSALGTDLADLLDAASTIAVESELQQLAESRRVRDAEEAWDLIRRIGPVSRAELIERSSDAPRTFTAKNAEAPTAERASPDAAGEAGATADSPAADSWLANLTVAHRVFAARIAGHELIAAVEDAGRLRDGLGIALPVGIPLVFTEPVADPISDLVRRYARTHAPFRASDVAGRYGLAIGVVRPILAGLVRERVLSTGRLRPPGARYPDAGPTPGGESEEDFCDIEVMRRLRRRSLAVLRAEVEAVPPSHLATFLLEWQHVSEKSRVRGGAGLFEVIEQLAGYVMPAGIVESLVLPARVADYSPDLLDELLRSGDVVWRAHGRLGSDDLLVSLHPAETASATLPSPATEAVDPPGSEAVLALRRVFAGKGSYSWPSLLAAVRGETSATIPAGDVSAALWSLVEAGEVASEDFSAVRARIRGGPAATRAGAGAQSGATPGLRRSAGRGGRGPRVPRLGRFALATGIEPTPPTAAGRWSSIAVDQLEPTVQIAVAAELLLDRYGIVTRGVVAAEDQRGGFAVLYRALSTLEDAGRVRRGYFVEHLGAAQFSLPHVVDQLREHSAARQRADDAASTQSGSTSASAPVILSTLDPANPFGAALAWPDRPGDRSGSFMRSNRTFVVMENGRITVYAERRGKSLTLLTGDAAEIRRAAEALARRPADRSGGAVTEIDGFPALAVGALREPAAANAGTLDRETARKHLVACLAAAGYGLTPKGLKIHRARG